MPSCARRAALSAIIWSLQFCGVGAAPSINFPIDSQFPQVARVSQFFSFTFAESTFVSADKETITYGLADAPSWLDLDSNTRTLSGNVTSDTLGPTTFHVVAADSTGSVSSSVTIPVTDKPGPQLGSALLPQLSQNRRASAPQSLLLYPGEPFSIIFNATTFTDTTENTKYYATSADNSPLPSWLQFDPSALRFTGIGANLVSPSVRAQRHGVRMIASDVEGYADAVAVFDIVVTYKILTFSETLQWVKVSQNQIFSSDALRGNLKIDGHTIEESEIASVTSNAPSWAQLDTSQIRLIGSAPDDATDESVLITVTDVYGDVANTTVNLVVSESRQSLFTGPLPILNATIGDDFEYEISPSILSNRDVQMTAELANATWLSFDKGTLKLQGTVPETSSVGVVLITLKTTLRSFSDERLLALNITTASTRSASPTTSSSSLPTSSSQPKGGPWDRRKLIIALGVVLPLLFLAFLASFIACCYFKRKRQKDSDSKTEMDISRPMVSPLPEEVPPILPPVTPRPASPPRIDLPWAPDSMKKTKKRLSVMPQRTSELVEAGWGDLIVRDPEPQRSPKRVRNSGPPVASDFTPFVRSGSSNLNYSRKRTPLQPTQAKVRKPSVSSRASKTPSRLSFTSNGLPMRLSGAGHGAGGPSPVLRSGPQAWRNTTDSLFSDEGKRATMDLSAFPDPPGASSREIAPGRPERPTRLSVRLVPSSSSNSGSLWDQRQRWVKERARDRQEKRSRFSHAWSSRGPSYVREMTSSLRSPNARASYLDADLISPHRSMQQSISQTSSTDMGGDMIDPRGPMGRRPSHLGHALSTISSGRFDSVDSKSNSSWVDDLMEEEDEAGNRRWVAVDNTSPQLPRSSAQENLEPGSWGRGSRRSALGHLRGDPGRQHVASGERRWRLGGERAKRPVSVDDGDLQRSQGSQRGNLAFI